MDCSEDMVSSGPCSTDSGFVSSKPDLTRVSPLRGGLSQDEIVAQTRAVSNGLASLRDDHYNILTRIREECENQKNNCSKEEEEEDNKEKEEKERRDQVRVTEMLDRIHIINAKLRL